MNTDSLQELTAGMAFLYGGNRLTYVTEELAESYREGDQLVIVPETGAILHIPAQQQTIAHTAVDRALTAFQAMTEVSEPQISHFYDGFAAKLSSSGLWSEIMAANDTDVARAKSHGRSTTRLTLNDKTRQDMVNGLLAWRDMSPRRGQMVERVVHEGWVAEQAVDSLGVIGFVFEGRPNVFADAVGVIRGGNTVVFRIGSDALGTAQAIYHQALAPALLEAGLPDGAAVLIESKERSVGWALFADPRLSLAVARGSGKAVEQLGSIARQAGIPVSLHGTGGAWITADETADQDKFVQALYHSLDRKVCNTVNVCCVPRERAEDLVPALLKTLSRAGERRGTGFKLHVTRGSEGYLPEASFRTTQDAPAAIDIIPVEQLAQEWEWEDTPELSLIVVTGMAEAARLFNEFSPQFVACLITENQDHFNQFYHSVNAPFVGNGFTRWVDGQYAFGRPELGLSNWQHGRLFARSGVLSGDGIYTLRTRVIQSDPDVHR